MVFCGRIWSELFSHFSVSTRGVSCCVGCLRWRFLLSPRSAIFGSDLRKLNSINSKHAKVAAPELANARRIHEKVAQKTPLSTEEKAAVGNALSTALADMSRPGVLSRDGSKHPRLPSRWQGLDPARHIVDLPDTVSVCTTIRGSARRSVSVCPTMCWSARRCASLPDSMSGTASKAVPIQ